MNLKKKYLRKRKELKDSNKYGTSADAVTKAEKAFGPYAFLSWLDEVTQVREGRSNLPSWKGNTPSAEDGEEEVEKKEENADDNIQTEDSTLGEVFDDLPETKKVEKNPAKNKRKRKLLQGATKESYLEEKEFALITLLHEDIAEKWENKQRKKKKNTQRNYSVVLLQLNWNSFQNMKGTWQKTSYKMSFSNINWWFWIDNIKFQTIQRVRIHVNI